MKYPTLLTCTFIMAGSTACAADQSQFQQPQTQAGASAKEYRSSAKMERLLRDDLTTIAGKEATIQAVELAPGWVGEKHLHTGDVFVYIQDGD